MNRSICKFIAVLIFIQIATGSLLSHDPANGAASVTIQSRDPDSYKWFIKRTITAGSSYSFESVRFDRSAVNNKKSITYATTKDNSVKAVSRGYTCAALYDATASSEKLAIIKLVDTNDFLQENLIASNFPLVAADVPSKTFQVADSCTALRVNNAIYHLDASIVTVGATKYVADTLPGTAWTNPVFNGDFSYVAGDAGLYKYTAATKTYASVLATTFYTNKKIWTTSQGIVVLSWVDTATTNIKNFSVQAFAIPSSGSTYPLVGRIDGQYYDTVANAAPIISLSQSLRTVVIYAKSAASTFFARGKSFDYTFVRSTDFTIPTWITATQSMISVSDQYVYARNIVNNGATPAVKEKGSYFIGSSILTQYVPISTVAADDGITDWFRTKVLQGRSGQLYLVREHVTSTKVITLEELLVPPPATIQIFSWDKKSALTSTVTGPGTSFVQHAFKPQWFLWAKVSATKHQFYSVKTNSTTFAVVKSTYAVNQNYVLKAVSQNYKCALIYESAGPSLKVVNFDAATTATLYATVTASLYSGITLTDPLTTFDVADNCRAFRINNKVFHYYSDNDYHLDTYPDGTTSLSNPTFNQDFSLAITDNGIYKYSQKTAASAGIYNVDRADTFDTMKKVLRVGNNYIITSQRKVNSTHYEWKIQLNTIVNLLSTKIGEFSGIVQNNFPNILVSPKLSKVIVQGFSATNASLVTYVAKTIDWPKKVMKDIVLPTAINGILIQITLSDQFLYVNNILPDKKHAAYAIMGTTCKETFNQFYQFPSVQTFKRTFILPDPSGQRKLILAHQYINDDFVRLLKGAKKSISQFFNPNPISNSQMNFSWTGGSSFKSTSFPNFGKWFYTTSSGTTLNYIQYDTTVANKKKLITKTGLTGINTIVAVSSTFDCAITFVTGSDLNTIKVNSTDSTTTTLSAWANVVTSNDITAANLAIAIGNGKIGAGSNCWAIRADNFIYFKNPAGNAYTKSAAVASMTTPIFDQSLNFAYAGGKVYKYTGTDYVEIITVSGLKSTVKIYSSSDFNKLIILSYELVTGSVTSYTSVLKIYAYRNNTWQAGSLSSSISTFTTYIGRPNIFTNPTFQLIGVQYTGGSAPTNFKPIVFIGSVNYTVNTLKQISIPKQFTPTGSIISVFIFGDFIHVTQMFGSQVLQRIYKVDKSINKLIQIRNRPVSIKEFTNTKNVRIFEQNQNLIAIYQTQQNYDVSLIKRIIGTQTQRQTVSGINSRDAGLLVQNGQVYLCPPGCTYCVNPNTCENCLPGFVLDISKTCLKCASLCKSCTTGDLQTCTQCIDGYYVSGGVCNRCSDNCITCSGSASGCTACKPGYYVSGSACIPCVDNCVSCNPVTNTDALCDTCRKGFVYSSVSKTCVKCVAGCSVCNPQRVYQCLSCAIGYETVTINNVITCNKCPNNCNICNNGTCQLCRDGFRLVNNTCITQCRLPCQKCDINDPTKCTSCVGGYNLNNQTCTPDLSCNNNKTCTSCPLGYNLVLGVCYQCNGGDNCRTCDNNNIEQCASCNRGFFLTQSSTCKACNITGCVTCSSQIYCDQCKPGYVLSGSSAGKCLRCDDSCATCFDSPSNCQTCAQGYTKKGWNCINKNNIKVQLKVNADFATFSTTNYSSIQQDICDRISKDPKHVNVDKLRNGSVVIVLEINVDNTNQQANQISSLQSALSVGSTIGGFSIQSSTLTAVTGGQQTVYSDSQAKKYRDIAIIVGVVIPVGLIILFIIFFILYKKGAICANHGSKVGQHSMETIQVKQYN